MRAAFADISQAIADEFSDESAAQAVVLLIRLLVAAAVGALLGWDRQKSGKPAGIRTYILVGAGSAALVSVARQAGFQPDPLSRVLQGLIAGVGFIGAGCILKSEGHVTGLTTAAGIWLMAGVGVAAGMSQEIAALLIGLLGWLTIRIAGSSDETT